MDDLDYDHLLAQVRRYEGFKLRHYQDAGGNLSVAEGRAIRNDPQQPLTTPPLPWKETSVG